jgi:peptidyl-tRNA hydrolase
VDHVLGKFPPEEERLLPELFDIVEGAIRCALETGVHEAMNRYNRDWMGRLTGAEPPVTS